MTGQNVIPLEQINTFESFMQSPAVRERVTAVLPRHLTPERIMRVVALAAYKTPKLRECHMMSLLGGVMICASMGFEPNTPLQHAFLIPFEKKKFDREKKKWVTDRVDVNVIFGYPGLIDLSRRTGSLVSITAKVVYEGDSFSFEYGSNQHLRHTPVGNSEGRDPLWAYAYSKLTDGEAFECLPYDEALAFRRYSQTWVQANAKLNDDNAEEWEKRNAKEAPWIKHEPQMVQKTMVRRLTNWLPKNIEFQRAVTIDGLADAGKIDYAALAALPPAQAKEMLEEGVVPEKKAADDDAPESRPEKPAGGKKTAKAKPQQDVAKTSNETAGDAEQDPAPKDEPKPDETPPMSEALESALSKLKDLTYDEIAGARDFLRERLTKEDFSVWQGESLRREQTLSKNRSR